MDEITLFFVARMKNGEVLFAQKGPYVEEDQARQIADIEFKPQGACYSGVVSVRFPCTIVDPS